MEHLSATNLERYYLGMIPDGPELAAPEEHLLICGECVDRAEETQDYVDAFRDGIIRRRFDLQQEATAIIEGANPRQCEPRATLPIAAADL